MTERVRSYRVQAFAAHPLMARGEVIGTLSFGARDRPRFTGEELAVMKTVADHVAIALDRDRAERELRRREAEAAAQDERSRLARDLHDSVTQALFAASLKAEALTLGDDDVSAEAGETIEQLRRLNRGALAQMRTMLLELRDEPLEAVPVSSSCATWWRPPRAARCDRDTDGARRRAAAAAAPRGGVPRSPRRP